LAAIEAAGNQAFAAKHHKNWKVANDSLGTLIVKLKKVLKPKHREEEDELPPTWAIKDFWRQQVDAEREYIAGRHRELRDKPRYASLFKGRLEALEPCSRRWIT